jgi:hypothetical protein
LADWLIDYFYKTEDGTWRLPSSTEEEALKEKTRAAGTNRRIKRFAGLLTSGAEIPAHLQKGPATLADWIRQCKLAGLFDIGKLLYERGEFDESKLSDEMAADVYEDYQVCLRSLQRSASPAATGKKRGRKIKGAGAETKAKGTKENHRGKIR